MPLAQDVLPALEVLDRLPPGPAVALRDGERTIVGRPSEILRLGPAEAPEALHGLTEGFWACAVAYDLGRSYEPFPARTAPEALPDLILARLDERVIVASTGHEIVGHPDWLGAEPAQPSFEPLDGWASSLDRPAYIERVHAILDHLRAGDCYQVNLTRRLTCPRAPHPRALHRALATHHPAPFGGLIDVGDVAVVTVSPERFLKRSGDTVTTQPIKGTAADPAVLRASRKDRAENVMIVDLARNDLGRVCRPGTVRVPDLCALQEHPGLYHLVSTVTGHLRAGVTWGELIAATFPPASVTGCPKPRVLGIIEELEPVRRGMYCGAVGWIDADQGTCDLNVAIRTFTIADGRTTFGVGGGIVADSDPDLEWDETELKARRLLAVASGR